MGPIARGCRGAKAELGLIPSFPVLFSHHIDGVCGRKLFSFTLEWELVPVIPALFFGLSPRNRPRTHPKFTLCTASLNVRLQTLGLIGSRHDQKTSSLTTFQPLFATLRCGASRADPLWPEKL